MKLRKNWKRFFSLNRHHAEGFTLVELIVVIAILAILGGVAVPAYSGYVAKAERAGDEQLLAAVNQAFASACAVNGTDNYKVGKAYANLADGKVDAVYVTAAGDAYDQAFDTFFSGNTESAFKVYKGLSYNSTLGMFQPISDAYAALFGIFSEGDITNFNGSVFASLGLDVLMEKVDLATLTAMEAADGSTLNKLVMSAENRESLAKYLGFENSSAAGFNEAYAALVEKKAAQMIAAGADASNMPLLYQMATKEIMANNAVLVAATNSTFDTDAFVAQLAAGNGKTTIKTSMDTANGEQIALSQTAMAYAMYTSYMERSGGIASNNIVEVLDVLESDGFKGYMGTTDATNDLNGYLAAMNMINSASGNDEAVSSLLVNGFSDPDLLALLTQEINK